MGTFTRLDLVGPRLAYEGVTALNKVVITALKHGDIREVKIDGLATACQTEAPTDLILVNMWDVKHYAGGVNAPFLDAIQIKRLMFKTHTPVILIADPREDVIIHALAESVKLLGFTVYYELEAGLVAAAA